MTKCFGVTTIALLAASIALHGCATTTSQSIASNEGSIVTTTANERALGAGSAHPSTEGSGRIEPKQALCEEPSPDVATAVSNAVSAALEASVAKEGVGKGGVDTTLGRSATESIARLGSRLATIQLLRDELSDLCRAYANGAVSRSTYALRLSGLDEKVTTLLGSEASAVTLSRASLSIDGVGAAGTLPVSEKKRNAAEGNLRDAAAAVTTAGSVLRDLTKRRAVASEQSDKDRLDGELVEAQGQLVAKLSALQDRALERLAFDARGASLLGSSGAASVVAGLQPASPTPRDLHPNHESQLDEDGVDTLLDACLAATEDNQLVGDLSAGDERQQLQRTLDQASRAAIEAEQDLRALRGPSQARTQAALPRDQAKQLETAEGKFRMRAAERRAAQEALDAGEVAVDRTSLLTYCRRNLSLFARMLEERVRNKFELEYNRIRVEICESVLTSAGAPDDAKPACRRTLRSYPQQG